MTKIEKLISKIEKLNAMTIENGCTVEEAASAAEMAEAAEFELNVEIANIAEAAELEAFAAMLEADFEAAEEGEAVLLLTETTTENKMKKNWYKENLSRINLEAHRLLKVDNERRNGLVYRNQWRKAFCFAMQQVKQAVCREERRAAFKAAVAADMAERAKLAEAEIESRQMEILGEGVRQYYKEKDAARQPKLQRSAAACAVAAVDANEEEIKEEKKRQEREANYLSWAAEENRKKVAYLHSKNRRFRYAD